MQKYSHQILLAVTIIFALFVRVIDLANTPSGFHADEASFYVNSLALSQTGMDEDGNKYPLSLSSYIDPKPALFSYLQIPFIRTFDNQIFAARLPSVILSIISLFIFYLFVKEVSGKNIALLSLFLMAISPWHLIVSRGTQEVIASFTFLILTLYLFIKVLKSEKVVIYNYFFVLISAFLSMYFYHSAKVLIPFLLVVLVFAYFKRKLIYYKKTFVLVIIVFISLISSLFVQESSSRISAVGIFADQAPQHRLIEQIYTAHEELPIVVMRFFYNKVGAYSHAIINEYLQYFSPDYLFISGGKPYRYLVPNHGLLYLIELPLIAFGLYSLIKNGKKDLLIFTSILLLSPIPAALTRLETPSMIRSFPMIIALVFLIANGIIFLYKKIDRLPLVFTFIVISIIYLWQVSYFSIQYKVQAYYDQPWYRNSPYTEIANKVADISSKYKKVVVTNDLRPLYSYFVMENLISIQDLQQNPKARDNYSYSLSKFEFNRGVCEFGNIVKNTLYISEIECLKKVEDPSIFNIVSTISYQDDTPVYVLLEVK